MHACRTRAITTPAADRAVFACRARAMLCVAGVTCRDIRIERSSRCVALTGQPATGKYRGHAHRHGLTQAAGLWRFRRRLSPTGAMSDIDVLTAKDIFALLPEPLLASEERLVRHGSPTLDADAVLDLALQAAVVRLELTLTDEAFEHLRWKVIVHRSRAHVTIEKMPVTRAAGALVRDTSSRAFRDAKGIQWTVTEGRCHGGAGADRPCLLFSSDAAVRRVTTVPDDWLSMTDAELSTLSWSR